MLFVYSMAHLYRHDVVERVATVHFLEKTIFWVTPTPMKKSESDGYRQALINPDYF